MADEKPRERAANGLARSGANPGTLRSDGHAVAKSAKSAGPIVGIGASAGGLNALKKLLRAMPVDSGMAFVLVPHLDPTHESLMAELLARETTMPVVEVQDGTVVSSNRVYVIPPNKYLTLSEGVLRLSTPPQPRGLQTAIDSFLRSLAVDQHERSIGIVLSGTGSHGTPGLREIKLAGGLVIAQDPDTAEYDQMPRSAILSGVVDYVLPPEEMPPVLLKYIQQPYLNRDERLVSRSEDAVEGLGRVLAVLRARTKYDFHSYRKNMLIRRVQRRMSLSQIDQIADYVDLLLENPDELAALQQDLLINVTAFFRESEAFRALEQQIIPALVKRQSRDAPVRVWIPGCATGEEAYSVAMLLFEGFAAADKPVNVQIFASDIDEQALDVARIGIYPASIAGDVSSERLKRFFIQSDENHYQVNKQLRESICFALQNLISDAPFSRLDLISCRNLLIYLEPDVQQKVVTLFHFALIQDGYLLLGPSESIGRSVDLFEPVSKKSRVYRRIGPVRRELVEIPIVSTEGRRIPPRRSEPASLPPRSFKELTERLVLSNYAPASALINRKYEILFIVGPLVDYLEFPAGEPTRDLLSMARQGLRTKVRAACQRAIHGHETAIDADARVKRNHVYVPCTITVRSISEPKEAEGLILVTFQDRAESPLRERDTDDPSGIGLTSDDDESPLVQQLELELNSTREELQSTVEEMESSNEELKASNEEVMSMNEELQSANEELETSKEELQTLNEELTTVNNQLQDKVGELDTANNDLNNLMAVSDIATVFLDTELQIVRFTPATARLLNLRASDVGRPLRDFAPRFTDDNLLDECQMVLDRLVPVDRELRTAEDRHFLRRILPYRTADNRIVGVAITYVDITTRVQAEAESRHLATAMRDSNDAVTAHTLDGRFIFWNRGAERMYGYRESEALQMNVRDLIPEHIRHEALASIRCIAEGQESESLDTQRVTKSGRTLDIWLTVSKLVDEAGDVVAIATTERDVTNRKQSEAELQQLNDTLEQRVVAQTHEIHLLAEALANLGEGVVITTAGLKWPEPRIVFVNKAMCSITGYQADELIGQTPRILQGERSERQTLSRIKGELAAGRSCLAETVNYRKDGTAYDAELFVTPLLDTAGRQTNFVSIHRDISERKRAESKLREREEQLRAVLDTAADAIVIIDRYGIIKTINFASQKMFGYREDELLGQNVKLLMAKPYGEHLEGHLARHLETGSERFLDIRQEVVGRRRDGSTFPAGLAVSEVDHLGLFTAIIRDMTSLKEMEKHVLNIAAEEQRRIGQELHDGTGQELTGLSLFAGTIEEILHGVVSRDIEGRAMRLLEEADFLRLEKTSDRLSRGLAEANRHVQRLSHGILPVQIDAEGLRSALEELAATTDAQNNISCRLECSGPVVMPNNITALHLYRIAQEAVNNALKHSQADQIRISLRQSADKIILAVSDNGVGVDVDGTDASDRKGQGMGLRTMQYRAGMIGGTMRVERQAEGGMLVSCVILLGEG